MSLAGLFYIKFCPDGDSLLKFSLVYIVCISTLYIHLCVYSIQESAVFFFLLVRCYLCLPTAAASQFIPLLYVTLLLICTSHFDLSLTFGNFPFTFMFKTFFGILSSFIQTFPCHLINTSFTVLLPKYCTSIYQKWGHRGI